VARKSKTDQKKQTDPAGLDPASRATKGIVATSTEPKAAPPALKKKTSAAKKKPASGPRPRASEKAASPAAPAPSDEAIRIRAYFLAERRHRLSLPGDSAHDWIEAKRQLTEEARA